MSLISQTVVANVSIKEEINEENIFVQNLIFENLPNNPDSADMVEEQIHEEKVFAQSLFVGESMNVNVADMVEEEIHEKILLHGLSFNEQIHEETVFAQSLHVEESINANVADTVGEEIHEDNIFLQGLNFNELPKKLNPIVVVRRMKEPIHVSEEVKLSEEIDIHNPIDKDEDLKQKGYQPYTDREIRTVLRCLGSRKEQTNNLWHETMRCNKEFIRYLKQQPEFRNGGRTENSLTSFVCKLYEKKHHVKRLLREHNQDTSIKWFKRFIKPHKQRQ